MQFIKKKPVVWIMLIVYVIALIRTAWLSDDAYITYRTVDNFVNGYGLTFNPDERVQAFTNPLWMFAMSLLYLFTKEAYFTGLFLSISVSIISVFLILKNKEQSKLQIVIAATMLVFSKSFVDFSTSGLENPGTHLLLAIFFILYFHDDKTKRKLFFMSLVTSLAMVNRMDTILLFAPALIHVVFNSSNINFLRRMLLILSGFIPFIMWEIFSIFYYGFLFPNTAYAKLNTGISSIDYIKQGLIYLLHLLVIDPVTLFSIVITFIFVIHSKQTKFLVPSIGVILYLLYIIKVGGDFMGGRFLAAPLFLCVNLFTNMNLHVKVKELYAVMGLVVLLGVSIWPAPLFSPSTYENKSIPVDGIADERGYYYQNTGLLNIAHGAKLPRGAWVDRALEMKQKEQFVQMIGSIGFTGYYIGPSKHIIDYYALSDPLLARLPIDDTMTWRIGHYKRTLPEGYQESVEQGRNLIKDVSLAEYYNKLNIITRGRILSLSRFKTIWNMNTGKYDYLLVEYLRNKPFNA